MQPGTANRDVVVVGASAGGIEALCKLVGRLPRDLRATMMVVQHLAPSSPRHLVSMLQQCGEIPIKWAEHGEPLNHARVLVAPPNQHLLVEEGRVVLSNGPRENYARPSINRLFRSAAAHAGSRSIGVLLSGTMDDGVAGLEAIKWVGGTTLVQDPAEAEHAQLPQNAIDSVTVDRVASVETLALSLIELCNTPVVATAIPREVALHAALDRNGRSEPAALDALGPRSTAMCPECGGPLWQIDLDATSTYRCYLGHAMSARALVHPTESGAEQVLWTAVRTLEDRAEAYATMSRLMQQRQDATAARLHDEDAARARDQARRIMDIIVELQKTP